MFSVQKSIDNAKKTKLRRAKVKSKGNINKDYDIAHGTEIKEAERKEFTTLKKRVNDEFTRFQNTRIQRDAKLHG